MSCKCLFMSPLHNTGTSLISVLAAQCVTFEGKRSAITYTSETSPVPDYLGIENVNDPTRSIMQLVRLIDAGAIADDAIGDYMYTWVNNGQLLNITDPSLTERDKLNIIRHVYSRIPTDVCICDNSEDISSPASQKLLDESDCVFLVVPYSKKGFIYLKSWLDSSYLKGRENTFIIINYYHESVSSVRDTAKYLGLSVNRVCKVHYNPMIVKCCMTGQLPALLPNARKADPRVAELNMDITEVAQCISSVMLTNAII